ncbi:DUF721 domain-containing protein [Fodinicurvata halophila]|uniref:DUF721 domain-containing protein n=1 Tax=Fodinicurvata halophila TaxID=1419723 RepID=UPI0036358595
MNAASPKDPAERGAYTRSLSRLLRDVTAPALAKRSRAEASLILDWATIVGADLAAKAKPVRLSFPKRSERRGATLLLRVDSAYALDLQHQEPQVIERVNTHFGYSLVSRLRLEQAPVRETHQRPRTAPRLPPACRRTKGPDSSGS